MIDTPQTALPLPAGTMLGKYEVLRKLATGGMGEIYLARVCGHAGFEKLFVIKRILSAVADNERRVEMFLAEARLLATLQHPNIADVYDVGTSHGAPWFAMEHVLGEDVRMIRYAASEQRQGVPLRVSLAIAHAVASALQYAHDRVGSDGRPLNIVHRDISSSNILVSYEGAIKLIDFGVARAKNRTRDTQVGAVKGKAPYMSPEQCQGLAVDRRSDLFALGVVLYELTLGKRPFEGASAFDIMEKIVHSDARPPTKVSDSYPPDLERIVLKLLARDVDARYASAQHLLNDLDTFMGHYNLWVPPTKISRYMRKLFAHRIAAWEAATRGDVVTFVENAALAIGSDHGYVTPPTPVPVVMRLSHEIQAVALDAELSLARPLATGEDPLDSMLGGRPANESVALSRDGDTITVRTGDSMIVVTPHDPSNGRHGDTITGVRTLSAGDTVTGVRTLSAGDTITQPRADVLSGDTVTQRLGDTITVRPGDTITVRPGDTAPSDVSQAHAFSDEKTAPVARGRSSPPTPVRAATQPPIVGRTSNQREGRTIGHVTSPPAPRTARVAAMPYTPSHMDAVESDRGAVELAPPRRRIAVDLRIAIVVAISITVVLAIAVGLAVV